MSKGEFTIAFLAGLGDVLFTAAMLDCSPTGTCLAVAVYVVAVAVFAPGRRRF